jgi:hypothetical protein
MNTTPKDRIAIPRGQFFDDDDAQGEAWWAPESGIPAGPKNTKAYKALSS